MCVLADEREARESPAHQDYEVAPAAAPPEVPMPGGATERAIGFDVPVRTAKVVQVELHQAAQRREIIPTDGTNTHPCHGRYVRRP